MFLYVKKYLFSFLNKLYNDAKIIIIMAFSIAVACVIPIILSIIFHPKITAELSLAFGLPLFSFLVVVLFLAREAGGEFHKKEVEIINKNIAEKLAILKSKKLLESKIKNSKIKNNGKKYL